ncbi:MAG: HEAT repeat domain-containing protein [Nostoc sp.]|uniref:HEAT repeat domain-containing protein n=1 Tax=Nostoc sp. TaxID=1180 RepID=UPI002FF99847
MTNNQNQPGEFDAVLGGEAPPPVQGAVLGGIEGVKRRLASFLVKARIDAVNEALKYGNAGLDLVIAALNDESSLVQRSAYLLLRERTELQVQQAVKAYKSWRLPERLEWYTDDRVSKFANKKVEDFDPAIGIIDPMSIAYAVRCEKWEEDGEVFREKLNILTQHRNASKIQALVIGIWDGYGDYDSSVVVNALVEAKDKLKNLKAIFIGDIEYSEYMISTIEQSDISPLLKAYHQLEIIQIRGGHGLQFSQLKHENLKGIIIESGALKRQTIAQICALDLPALQHLELWLGGSRYGGNSSIDDLMPIISGELFPTLSYLGLRNGEYSDYIARSIVNMPAIKFINILDLAMGTLSDEGAKALLNCSDVNKLDILNVTENFLSAAMIERLSQLDCQLIYGQQGKEGYGYNYIDGRYCSIAE